MTHWMHPLHILLRRRRFAASGAGETSAEERARVEALAAGCPACRRELEAHRLVSAALASAPRVVLAPEEAAAFRAAVHQRIERARPAARPARPGLREILADHPRMSLASAMAAVAVVLGLTLGPMLGQEPSAPAKGSGVEVMSVEAGEGESVMVFQPPGGRPPVIWVFEASPT